MRTPRTMTILMIVRMTTMMILPTIRKNKDVYGCEIRRMITQNIKVIIMIGRILIMTTRMY